MNAMVGEGRELGSGMRERERRTALALMVKERLNLKHHVNSELQLLLDHRGIIAR